MCVDAFSTRRKIKKYWRHHPYHCIGFWQLRITNIFHCSCWPNSGPLSWEWAEMSGGRRNKDFLRYLIIIPTWRRPRKWKPKAALPNTHTETIFWESQEKLHELIFFFHELYFDLWPHYLCHWIIGSSHTVLGSNPGFAVHHLPHFGHISYLLQDSAQSFVRKEIELPLSRVTGRIE